MPPNIALYILRCSGALSLIVGLALPLAAREDYGNRLGGRTGGQTTFTITAAFSNPGRSVIVTPSSSIVNGCRISRIVPMLEPGSVVTAQRAFVDYVVTEYGIAELRGKTLKQRAAALVEICHPDFKPDLLKEAKRIYFL